MNTGKHLFVKVIGLQACNFIKKRVPHECFSVNIVKFLGTPTLKKHLRTTASEDTPTVMLSYEICEIFKNNYFEEHLQKTFLLNF